MANINRSQRQTFALISYHKPELTQYSRQVGEDMANILHRKHELGTFLADCKTYKECTKKVSGLMYHKYQLVILMQK